MTDLESVRVLWAGAALLFASVALNAGLLLRYVVTDRRKRLRLGRAALSIGSLVGAFLLAELVFANVLSGSDGFGETLAARRWMKRWWRPVNSQGYRDAERELEGKRVLFAVGDSFVAGYGVERIEDRFADRFARKLGPGWALATIAQIGWHTRNEVEAIQRHPARPDLVVLSYYINDILGAAQDAHHVVPVTHPQPGPLGQAFVDRSFFLNWLYWRLSRATAGDDYWRFLEMCFRDETTWGIHAAELTSLADLAKSAGAPLCVVVWPQLNRVAPSRPMTRKVANHMRRLGAVVVDLTDVFEGRPARELVVNALDSHPSARTHAEVAEILQWELAAVVAR